MEKTVVLTDCAKACLCQKSVKNLPTFLPQINLMQKNLTQKTIQAQQKRADKCYSFNRFLKTDLRNIFLEIRFA